LACPGMRRGRDEREEGKALPEFVKETDWVAVIVTVLVASPISALVHHIWKRWREPFKHESQSKKDRHSYDFLLRKYEAYLDLLSDLIVIRAQVEAGPSEYTPEMEREFIRTRDGIYRSLETRGKTEKEMGVFQLMDILEGRMVGAKELRKRRSALEERQAEIEEHPLFIRRDMD
jgi:hypothetical protein